MAFRYGEFLRQTSVVSYYLFPIKPEDSMRLKQPVPNLSSPKGGTGEGFFQKKTETICNAKSPFSVIIDVSA